MPIANTFNPISPVVRVGQGASLANREDLSSELQTLAPEQTPMLSLCAKGKMESTYSEWNVDRLKSPVTIGIAEGLDVQNLKDKGEFRARLGNYGQIFREAWIVSNLQNAVKTSTGNDVLLSQGKCIREVKRNIEAAICSFNEMSVENGGGIPYQMRGAGRWLQATAQAINPVPVDYRTPTASIVTGTPSETQVNDMLSSIFSKTGQVDTMTLIAGIALRKSIANMQRTDGNAGEGVYNITQESGAKKIVLSVQTYESDFGLVNLVNGNPDCMPTPTTGFMMNPKYMAFKTLVPLQNYNLENQGAGQRGYVEGVGSFQCLHPQAHGIFN